MQWMQMATSDRQQFIEVFFNRLDSQHLDWVKGFYSPEAVLEDPLGSHRGLASIESYYKSMYEPVEEIAFEFEEIISQGEVFFAPWVMKFKSQKLNAGKPIAVQGVSHLRFDQSNHVVFHRDTFDMGAMVYEHVPILGSVIRWLKGRF